MEWNHWEHQKAESIGPGSIRAITKTERPNGKAVRLRPGRETTCYELKASEPRRLIEWERSWPGAPWAAHSRLRLELVPRGSGTEVVLRFRAGKPKRHLKRALRFLLRPLAGPSARFYLRSKAQGIAHALTQ